MKERSLVLFTILSQMAVGAFLVLGLLNWFWSASLPVALTGWLVNRGLLLIGVVFLLGLLASLFHLGSPQNAWRALSNLRRSWLSREIFFALLFAGAVAIFTLINWFSMGTTALRVSIALLAGLFGLAMIYCMARVYMLPTAPTWNSWLTSASFFATMLLLGSLAVGAVLAIQLVFSPRDQAFAALTGLQWIGELLLMILLIEFVLIPLQIRRLAGQHGSEDGAGPLSRVYIYRITPLFLGIVLAGILFFAPVPPDAFAALGVLLAFGLVLLAELFGRSLFYAGHIPRM